MDDIAVSQSIKVSIKGQEFELTLDEAKALATALGLVVAPPSPMAPYQPPLPQRRPQRPWDRLPTVPDDELYRRHSRDRDRIIMQTLADSPPFGFTIAR